MMFKLCNIRILNLTEFGASCNFLELRVWSILTRFIKKLQLQISRKTALGMIRVDFIEKVKSHIRSIRNV